MARTRAEITVTGTVQGVGFRPFVYRLGTGHHLDGTVKNAGAAGVEIAVEGQKADIEAFVEDLRDKAPPLSSIESIDSAWRPPEDIEGFGIVPSTSGDSGAGVIPPDTGMCDDCLEELFDPESRYHRYWGTSCVNCGPRFTVIEELPYDRPATTMSAFPMCDSCRSEYIEPSDRRYHAQTIACPDCGPTLTFEDETGTAVDTRTGAIERAVDRLRTGDILAIKGVGGSHLACTGTDPAVVENLRERTGRPAKPFALMAPSIGAIEEFATIGPEERAALEDVRRPIVLVEKDGAVDWLDAVAPGLHTVGVMLPYAGLHHLLFDGIETPLVMTSGNLPGEPMCVDRECIQTALGDVIDGAVVHDRRIEARCDDSVVRFVGDQRRFLRRSRGWVPEPLALPSPTGDPRGILAMGGAYDTTVGITTSDRVLLSQHLGDVDDPQSVHFLRGATDHLLDLTGVEPSAVACDMHPEFATTRIAEEWTEDGLEGPVRVQHHHAHAASLLAEADLDRAIVIAADGTGYGPDGTVWGGEVLDATFSEASRVGGLDSFELPGGEAAVTRPARTLASLLDQEERIDDLLVTRDAVDSADAAAIVRSQLDQGVNVVGTTSAGRFLDAISALLGTGTHRRYQGEPAMRLEALAGESPPVEFEIPYSSRDDLRVVDVREIARRIDDMTGNISDERLAATAQWALGTGLADIAVEQAERQGIEVVGFTGGVAYNEAITRAIADRVADSGLTLVTHDEVPPGDGGLSYGQAVVAAARLHDSA